MKIEIVLAMGLLLGFTGCSSFNPAPGAQPGQTAQVFEHQQTLKAGYLLYLPKGYGEDAKKQWPLILFLHGVGERGTDPWLVAKHGVPKIDTTLPDFPFLVVSPQCAPDDKWSDELLLALLNEVEAKYSVDRHRVYLTGLSMGGFGTWSLGLHHPERFAAIAPLCGGGDLITPFVSAMDQKEALASLPIWAFHGAKDPVVPLAESQRMVDALKNRFGVRDVKLTVYPDAQHDCWTQTYANPDLYAWFLLHAR
jgi:predicted peptidase